MMVVKMEETRSERKKKRKVFVFPIKATIGVLNWINCQALLWQPKK
jgi:hypothetical protein